MRAEPADTATRGHTLRESAVERVAPLLKVDPELGASLHPARRRAALQQILVRVRAVHAGAWDPRQVGGAGPGDLGLLVVDGVIAREVVAERIISTELLGAGDVIRAGRAPCGALIRMSVQWSVLAQARIALLDARVAGRLASFPELLPPLAERLVERSERLAVDQAISKLTGVDRRLVALFWHIADRWGRSTEDGIAIPLRLSHRMLAQLVGARRPSVTTALAALARDGVLVRAADGSWLLTSRPRRTAATHLHPVEKRPA